MANAFDQFDVSPKSDANPFDQFDVRQSQNLAGPSDIQALGGIGENVLNLATSIPAGLGGGLNYLAVLASTGDKQAAKAIQEETQEKLTYQPRSEAGKSLQSMIQYPFKKLSEGAEYAGGVVSEKTGSPVLGAAAGTLIEASPMLIGGKKTSIPEVATSASEKAKTYVTDTVGMDWDKLHPTVKKQIEEIAKESRGLEKLDPKAVERRARLTSLGIPATRGQVTRDLGQITLEENISKSAGGKPIRDVNAEQDVKLHGLLDDLRKATGSTAQTREAVGKSIQGASREKVRSLKNEYSEAYKKAEESGATRGPADVSPLEDWLKNPTNKRNAGYLESAINDYKKGGKVSVNELEEIRKEAVANKKKTGPESHYAGEAIKVIDDILDKSGGDAYKEARGKFKAYKDEFDRQGRIQKLVTEKGMSSDRAVALEDTLDHVLKSPSEDIAKIKKSLLEGGTDKTKASGEQAWKDIQGGVIDKLKDAAAGKKSVVGENDQLQFNSSFRDVFNELDKDGKIDAIFSKEQAEKLREINKAVGDVRTKPSGRIAGSDSVPRIIAMLDKIPVAGDVISGTAMGAKKLYEMGKEARLSNRSVKSELEEAAARAGKSYKRKQTLEDIERASVTGSKSAPLTLERDSN